MFLELTENQINEIRNRNTGIELEQHQAFSIFRRYGGSAVRECNENAFDEALEEKLDGMFDDYDNPVDEEIREKLNGISGDLINENARNYLYWETKRSEDEIRESSENLFDEVWCSDAMESLIESYASEGMPEIVSEAIDRVLSGKK